jgi:hypothetical protein
MSRQLSLFATGVFLQVASSSIVQAQALDVRAALDLITNTADRICYRIGDKGSASNTDVKGTVNVELNGLASLLAGAGVKGTGSITNDDYQNVLRQDLAGLISQSAACKERVFNSLAAKLLIVTPPVTAVTPPLNFEYDPVKTVRAFYAALSRADGNSAATFVVPEKTRSGLSLSAAKITDFFSSLREPLEIESIKRNDNDSVNVTYHFTRPNRSICHGDAKVNTIYMNGQTLIQGISANC